MDRSETYIKMCEKAEEIQALKLKSDLDSFWYGNDRENDTWLPRQDQLQAMIPSFDGKTRMPPSLIYDLRRFFFSNYVEYTVLLKSMEQVWLAFVMNEKYGKVWDGKDWVTKIKKVFGCR